MTNIVFLQTSQ